ncbi:20251_t:CDS:1 [Funneliformis geosporum]|uniref:4324_t:CDS:1 n=1 Tax=Funneliformis geosporum TaxID=1117311 RepID=A0A9W4STD5_9GLOM|nr:20251_t:CDS:1 [Funneliformis geosporum]CAI2180880.1 4324_t:CDS:1 [Funneliformis geosporum]
MVAPRFTFFLIAVLVAFLVSYVEPTGDVECPPKIQSEQYVKEKTEKFIVIFKNEPSAKKEESIMAKHYKIMKECYNKRVEHVLERKLSPSSKDNDVLREFSIGTIQGYSANFGNSFVKKQLTKMKGLAIIEKDAEVKINYAVPQLYKRTIVKNPTPNIDRIDQAKRPLDNSFTFPDTAGEGVNIFIIDTGISTTHSEFEGRAKSLSAFCDGCNEDDENGHGTHVASIAAGKTLGVARKANLISVRVLNADGAGKNSDVINGLSAVFEQHAKGKNKNSVVNMSLGGGFSLIINDAVQMLTDNGIHVVVAAGNDGANSCQSSPASAPSVITVGATEANSDDIAIFSNFGKCTDIFAPGVDITGADFSNDKGEVSFSGTSQASPHVAGTIALVISKDGNQSPAEMAKSIVDLSTKGVVKGLDAKTPNMFLRVPAA